MDKTTKYTLILFLSINNYQVQKKIYINVENYYFSIKNK